MKAIPPGTLLYVDAARAIGQRIGREITATEYQMLLDRFGLYWPADYIDAIGQRIAAGYPPVPNAEPRNLSHVEAAQRLVQSLKRPLTVQENQRLRAWFPRGVPEQYLAGTAQKLARPRPDLRIVKP